MACFECSTNFSTFSVLAAISTCSGSFIFSRVLVIDLASKCEMIQGHNIYFATTLEYWFAGGTKIDYPEIRIFHLYERRPWRDTDIGITPDMAYANEWCTIIKPYYMIGN